MVYFESSPGERERSRRECLLRVNINSRHITYSPVYLLMKAKHTEGQGENKDKY